MFFIIGFFQVKSFKDYVELFVKGKTDDNDMPLKVIYEKCSPRWEVAVTISDKGFQHMSFVNSIATTKVCVVIVINNINYPLL